MVLYMRHLHGMFTWDIETFTRQVTWISYLQQGWVQHNAVAFLGIISISGTSPGVITLTRGVGSTGSVGFNSVGCIINAGSSSGSSSIRGSFALVSVGCVLLFLLLLFLRLFALPFLFPLF